MTTTPRSGLVAVLFTDLVGSTELMTQLGERQFDEVRREHFSALGRAVVARGGEEVKNTGDGILAVFGSAGEAVEAAVAMQQATAHQKAPVPLAMRVGVAVGDATLEDGDVFGAPVVEAARLVAAAEAGQILVTAVVRTLGGGRTTAGFAELGSVELKGLPEPVAVCEVAWAPLPAAFPMPPLLARTGRVFVGRDAELERLAQLWKEAVAGERRVALLAGEPGIGKTRLAEMAAQAAHDEGGLVLAGRCDEDLGVPYQPFVEALRHYVLNAGSEARLGRHGGELVRLVPEVADTIPGLAAPLRSDPETERYRLFDAVAAWLAAVSAETPLLLVLDDLQWAAKPTLLLLRHVLRSAEAMPLLVVVTYRDTDVGRGHPLAEFLADLRREQGVKRLSLTGLDAPGVADYLVQASGHDLDDAGEELARAVWRETEGLPFFVAEVFRHLAESGGVEQQDGRWVVTTSIDDLGIPEGVRDVVGRRLSRLSEEANRVLACASVAGFEFEPAVVRTAGGFEEEVVLSAVEEAVRSRLLVEVPGSARRFRFSHALVRVTLYDELTTVRRVAFHRKVAEAIELLHAPALDDSLSALAHHWARACAASPETGKAVEYATRAGDRALTQLAHDEAATHYRQALELLDAGGRADDECRLRLVTALGEAQRCAGDPSYRATLLIAAELAQTQGDDESLVRAALANTRGTLMSAVGQVDEERVAVLQAALDAIGDDDSPARARLLATLGLELVWGADFAQRKSYSDQALAMARRLGDPSTLAHVLMARFYTITEPGTVSDRMEETGELLRVSESLEDPVIRCRAYHLRTRVASELPDLEEAQRCITAYEQLAEELSQPVLGWIGLWFRTGLLLVSGQIAEAERLVERILEVGQRTGQPDAAAYWALHLFDVRRDQGRLAEVETDLAAVVREFPRLTVLRALLNLLFCEIDDVDRARRLFEEFAADFSVVPVDVAWMRTMTTLAEVCIHLGDATRAAELFAMLATYGDQLSAAAGALGGSVSLHLGTLATTAGNFDEAAVFFARSAQMHDHIGAPTWLARTRLEWARMLLTRRASDAEARAHELVNQALATARELGLATVERRALALLEQT